MCVLAALPALAGIGQGIAGAAATAGSAIAGAVGSAGAGMTVGSALQVAGTIASVGGGIWQTQASASASRQQAAYIERQSAMERQLAGVEDERTRSRMRSAIAQQRSELLARGVSLDSPTALLLGRQAGEELSYASQSVRSRAGARAEELGVEARSYRARATSALLKGGFSAAGDILTAVPQLWPGLADRKLLA